MTQGVPVSHPFQADNQQVDSVDIDLANKAPDAFRAHLRFAGSNRWLMMTNENTTSDTGTEIGQRDAEELHQWRRNSGAARNRGGQPGNTNNLQHGVYANRFLSPEEKPLFDAIITQLHEDFVFNKSSDFMQVELVAVYFLKLGRAQEACDWEAAERLDRMIRCHLKDLKATKIAREGEVPKGPETTPAEWATALLEKWAEAHKQPDAEGIPAAEKTEMTADNTVPPTAVATSSPRETGETEEADFG